MGNSAQRDKRKLAKQEKRRQALELRKQGFTYEQIATALSMSVSGAHKMVRDAIAAIPADEAKAVRALELARLDSMQEGLWERASRGGEKAVSGVLRIMERRAALLGLDTAVDDGGWERAQRELAAAEGRLTASLHRLAEQQREAAKGG